MVLIASSPGASNRDLLRFCPGGKPESCSGGRVGELLSGDAVDSARLSKTRKQADLTSEASPGTLASLTHSSLHSGFKSKLMPCLGVDAWHSLSAVQHPLAATASCHELCRIELCRMSGRSSSGGSAASL